jgi:hypothetical protein
MKSNSYICWLEQGKSNWALLLGDDIDKKLIAAISLAIERQE